MPNRLSNEASLYLQQHKDNPVDWHPWGDEAFAKAKAENKPVFLSVGYATCHWCHVMEHESFEDDEVAALLNDRFVSVKVDREERPDVDDAYMTAVQLMGNGGGWPMTVFLTPDRTPFFAGTYFPKSTLIKVATQISDAWRSGRKELEDAGRELANAIAEVHSKPAPGTFAKLDEAFVETAVQALAKDFDGENGGFGGAPKFPPHGAIEALMAIALRDATRDEIREFSLGMALTTLERICRGGIRDHVAGGFHRYSTDDRWHLPHFEKTLYDNALMLKNLVVGSAIAAQIDPRLEALFTDAAMGTMRWLNSEMRTPDGLYCSGQDADVDGEEGAHCVWTAAEIRNALGGNATPFMRAYAVEETGNYADEATQQPTGKNVLHLVDPTVDVGNSLEVLAEIRRSRPAPALDDKAIVSWNGLMIAALVDAGQMVEAERVATAILEAETVSGSLPHSISGGKPHGLAFLDDYAGLVNGLIRLGTTAAVLERVRDESPEEFAQMGFKMGATSGRQWLESAQRLGGEMIAKFYDEDKGGFFSTAEGHEQLFGRSKPVFDQPVPSGNAIALQCLLALGDKDRATRTVECFLGWMQRAPQATEALLHASLSLVQPSAAEPEPKAISREVEVSLKEKELKAGPDGFASGEITLTVPDGFHINGPNPPARWLVPTSVAIQPVEALVAFPEATEEQYSGVVTVPFRVSIPPGEDAAEFEIRVGWQACTDTECLEPREKVFSAVALR